MNESAPPSGPKPPSSGQRWPDGWTKLHVYLTDLDQVKAVAESYREVIDRAAGDRPVPHEWLHATVASVECDAASIDGPTLERLIRRLRAEAGEIKAFPLTIGPALAATGAIMLDTFPDSEFGRLKRACVDAINATIEGGVGHPGGGPGHVSLSYRSDDVGVDRQRGAIQNKLRDVRPGRTEITVTGVDLVRVSQSDDASTYTWEYIARIPLGE
ncbi:2'-5' RNA ligase family protein [Glycomyces sp. TRM65418]|uniref:2'-5' RNA ligase family protein n=1 Tax=Glycomyces sp. TRM65418 TaxID=2867006 RepID=UPI001CE57160|nr:2'-5' RNA ligase family protein [Glycomyces sp. TRM65418]MCC3765444.1 2'-5' RNA ligase family protein [Glycomyces sp. TRM65418]QZD55054.1 2'-5' RNA ligase family protein [Glycomyces sp. TRM65418]